MSRWSHLFSLLLFLSALASPAITHILLCTCVCGILRQIQQGNKLHSQSMTTAERRRKKAQTKERKRGRRERKREGVEKKHKRKFNNYSPTRYWERRTHTGSQTQARPHSASHPHTERRRGKRRGNLELLLSFGPDLLGLPLSPSSSLFLSSSSSSSSSSHSSSSSSSHYSSSSHSSSSASLSFT